MAYEIEFITDQRDRGTKKQLQSMDKKLKHSLKGLACVSLREGSKIREITFPRDVGEGTHKQWRKKYVVSKTCRGTTWDEVMTKINKIQAPFYKRVK